MKFLIFIFLSTNFLFASEGILRLRGLPLQADWHDIDGDGVLEYTALMLESQTNGQVETFYENGSLKGRYEDVTTHAKYLVTYDFKDGSWLEAARLDLGKTKVLGFHLSRKHPGTLLLWQLEGLTVRRYERQWEIDKTIPAPSPISAAIGEIDNYTFILEDEQGLFWLPPDDLGIHVIPVDGGEPRFIRYPDGFTQNQVKGGFQKLSFYLPKVMRFGRESGSCFVFNRNGEIIAKSIHDNTFYQRTEAMGLLVDLDHDGLPDLLDADETTDVDGLKDIKKVQTNLKVYHAEAPLVFPEEPHSQQWLPGFIIANDEDDMVFDDPFLDLNGDHRTDLAGIAIKLSWFQIVRMVSTGSMRMTFLLSLHQQNEDGTFSTLAGGPFEMSWKLNLRKLKLPELAQIGADFTGDGWVDILMPDDKKPFITPVDAAGFRHEHQIKIKLPKEMRDPDQLSGEDIDGDGKAELIVVKIADGLTKTAIIEVSK